MIEHTHRSQDSDPWTGTAGDPGALVIQYR